MSLDGSGGSSPVHASRTGGLQQGALVLSFCSFHVRSGGCLSQVFSLHIPMARQKKKKKSCLAQWPQGRGIGQYWVRRCQKKKKTIP